MDNSGTINGLCTIDSFYSINGYNNGIIMVQQWILLDPLPLQLLFGPRRYDTLGGGSVSADASSDKADVAWMTIEWGNTMGKMNKSWGIILEISYHITC